MHLVNHHASKTLVSLVSLSLWFLMAGVSIAQSARTSEHWLGRELTDDLSRGSTSKTGGQIASFPCDPMMNAKRENEILLALGKETPFGWGPKTPLNEMVSDLSLHFPVILDVHALEEIGLEADVAVGFGLMINGREVSPKREVKKAKWWQQDGGGRTGERPKLVVDLLNRISNLDLTLVIRHGQVMITTIEAAEDNLATRIYDVTPLVSYETRPAWQTARMAPGTAEAYADFDSLMNIIETSIDADTWEALGGNSTMIPSPIRGRNWLVISTTSVTHWKVQRLLDRMNQ